MEMKTVQKQVSRFAWLFRLVGLAGGLLFIGGALLGIYFSYLEAGSNLGWALIIIGAFFVVLLFSSGSLAYSLVSSHFFKNDKEWYNKLDQIYNAFYRYSRAADVLERDLPAQIISGFRKNPDLSPELLFQYMRYRGEDLSFDEKLDQEGLGKFMIKIIKWLYDDKEELYEPVLRKALDEPKCNCSREIKQLLGDDVYTTSYSTAYGDSSLSSVTDDWKPHRDRLKQEISSLTQVTVAEYDAVYTYGTLKSFPSSAQAIDYIMSNLKNASTGTSDMLNIQQFIYKGLPTVIARIYPAGAGLSEKAREIDSFIQGYMVYKVGYHGEKPAYCVNYVV